MDREGNEGQRAKSCSGSGDYRRNHSMVEARDPFMILLEQLGVTLVVCFI